MENRSTGFNEEIPTLEEVSDCIYQRIYELGGTREKPCWQKLAKVLTGKRKKQINRGLLMQVATKRFDSNIIRRALKIPIIHKAPEDSRHDYRPRFSPTRMAAVLASETEQVILLRELLDEFAKYTKENG